MNEAALARTQPRLHCAALPPGPVADVSTLDRLLAAAWDDLVSDHDGMEGYKLLSRMESVIWNPPLLSFVIERHGGTVLGSTRAELQHWHVDVEKGIATLGKVGWRQKRPSTKRFPMKQIVAEIIDSIQQGQDDDRLQWDRPNKVKLKTCELFPRGSAYRMTLDARRKAFRSLVAAVLIKEGWGQLGYDVFVRQSGRDGNGELANQTPPSPSLVASTNST